MTQKCYKCNETAEYVVRAGEDEAVACPAHSGELIAVAVGSVGEASVSCRHIGGA